MVTSKAVLQKIREIVEKRFSMMAISALGAQVFTPKELERLGAEGVDTSNPNSLLEYVYYHNFINSPLTSRAPTSVEDMKIQQSQPGLKPQGEAHEYAIESINDKTLQLINKLKENVITRIEGIIRDNNDRYKMNALQNLDRSEVADILIKESSLGKVKQRLRDTAKESNRDWNRVAVTEISNALGIGSVDKIVTENKTEDLSEVYVYRKVVSDSLTCKYCRRFYGEPGATPKVYRLSTLLSNGSNYGKKPDSWLPCVGATHPNERCSQVIELKPGFKLLPSGEVSYIGMAEWPSYIHEVLVG